jgi:hypothetical protein
MSGKRLGIKSLGTTPITAVIDIPNMSNLDRNWMSDMLQEDMLYIPLIGNMESGDAFFLESRSKTLYVLQITVGASHPVKANGLNTIFDRFADVTDCCLVFVTPKNGQLQKQQLIVTQKGDKSISLPESAKKFKENQWVLEYEIPIPVVTIHL